MTHDPHEVVAFWKRLVAGLPRNTRLWVSGKTYGDLGDALDSVVGQTVFNPWGPRMYFRQVIISKRSRRG